MSQYTSYYLYQKYITYSGQTPVPLWPSTYSIDAAHTEDRVMKLENDPACGYEPPAPTPIYRWVEITYNPSDSSTYICDDCNVEPLYRTTSGTPYCNGYDKYQDVYYQVSYNSGVTWTTTATTSTLIEANSTDCGYVPPTPSYSGQYLTFRATENGTFSFNPTSGNSIQYSLDSGSTWSTLASGASTPTIASGDTVMWKGTMTPIDTGYALDLGVGVFSASNKFEVEGNIMSLLYGDNFSGQTSLSGKSYAFTYLFVYCQITSAENLVLPATTLAPYCYSMMFQTCTSLTTAPKLPATTLADYCYSGMFLKCSSLTTAPELPAATLVFGCYSTMFQDCTSLSDVTCLATDISAIICTSFWLANAASTGTFTKAASMSSWTTGNSGIPNGWTIVDAT